MLDEYNTKLRIGSQGFQSQISQIFSDMMNKIDKMTGGHSECEGSVGRAFAPGGFFSMQASSETSLASAVVLHTT